MELLPIKKWGNSNGIRVTKSIMDFLEVQTEDKVKVTQEEEKGRKRLIIESVKPETEMKIEELFANYSQERQQVELLYLGEPMGHEHW